MKCFIILIFALFFTEPPVWVVEPNDVRELLGSAVVIDCMAKGSPTPQVTWKRMIKSSSPRDLESVSQVDSPLSVSSGVSVPSSSDQLTSSEKKYHLIRSGPDYQVYENGSLRITTSSSGEFLCTASNGIGTGISKAVRLTVYGKETERQRREYNEDYT